MLMDIRPLIKNKNFRWLYFGQLISTFGSMITYVALPYHVYQLTHSSLAVGMMGVVELVPLLLTALLGGVLADSMDRKKLLIYAELGLSFGCLVLIWNALRTEPHVGIIYGVAAWMSALSGFHRPALESLTPRLVSKDEIPSVSTLISFKSLFGTVGAPALGGILIATFGLAVTYLIDFASFVVSLLTLIPLVIPQIESDPTLSPLRGIREGFRYAWSRPELVGSYLVDFIAMIFGMPHALFPAVAEAWGGARVVGFLYAAPAVGALIATLLSGWTKKVDRCGAAILVAATIWGLGITCFGLTQHFGLALFFLMLAGAGDAMSGVFRLTLWNQTIPSHFRGRLAGIEMISYASGPLLGNAESGLVASWMSTQVSIVSGGILCLLGVILCVFFLPSFWRYRLAERNFELIPKSSV